MKLRSSWTFYYVCDFTQHLDNVSEAYPGSPAGPLMGQGVCLRPLICLQAGKTPFSSHPLLAMIFSTHAGICGMRISIRGERAIAPV